MHELINKLLKKRGVTFEQLDESERAQLEKWKSILSGKEVTLQDVQEFCDRQITLIEMKFDIGNTSVLNDRLVLLHSVYRKLKSVVSDNSEKKREKLEAELTAMIIGE